MEVTCPPHAHGLAWLSVVQWPRAEDLHTWRVHTWAAVLLRPHPWGLASGTATQGCRELGLSQLAGGKGEAKGQGASTYSEMALAPQSKTLPARSPSARASCRSSQPSVSRARTTRWKHLRATPFSCCFTCRTVRGQQGAESRLGGWRAWHWGQGRECRSLFPQVRAESSGQNFPSRLQGCGPL